LVTGLAVKIFTFSSITHFIDPDNFCQVFFLKNKIFFQKEKMKDKFTNPGDESSVKRFFRKNSITFCLSDFLSSYFFSLIFL